MHSKVNRKNSDKFTHKVNSPPRILIFDFICKPSSQLKILAQKKDPEGSFYYVSLILTQKVLIIQHFQLLQ